MLANVDKNILIDSINTLAKKISVVLLREFVKLPEEYKSNFVMIKAMQLLLANLLCQTASDLSELDILMALQGPEITELTTSCSYTGFAEKFVIIKH